MQRGIDLWFVIVCGCGLQPQFAGKASDSGVNTRKQSGCFLEAVFLGASGPVHVAATCRPVFGNGNASSGGYRRWARGGRTNTYADECDPDLVSIPSLTDQSSSSPKGVWRAQRGAQSSAIGRSRGGLTTKSWLWFDALGNLGMLPSVARPNSRP